MTYSTDMVFKFYFVFLNYDYRVCTLGIQTDNPSQCCTEVFLVFI